MTGRARLQALLLGWALLGSSHAWPLATPDVVQRVGEMLPLDTSLVDERGHAVRLSRYFTSVPVVLVFGYYRCPTLCTTLMESVLLGLSASGLPPNAYRVIGIGIDPREQPLDALRKGAAYRETFGLRALNLLTGSEHATGTIAAAAGVSYRYDSRFDQYSHPLGFVVVSPHGRISRYFPGIAFDPSEARLALIEASNGDIGSLTERIFLRCAHYDPAAGRYSLAVMNIVRAVSVLIAAALGLWMWRRRRRAQQR